MLLNFPGKYKILYYDGFEKVVSRKGIMKKMTADDISKLVIFIYKTFCESFVHLSIKDLERFGQLTLLPKYPSALFDPNIEKRNLGKRRSTRPSDDVEGRKSAISARSPTPESHGNAFFLHGSTK